MNNDVRLSLVGDDGPVESPAAVCCSKLPKLLQDEAVEAWYPHAGNANNRVENDHGYID